MYATQPPDFFGRFYKLYLLYKAYNEMCVNFNQSISSIVFNNRTGIETHLIWAVIDSCKVQLSMNVHHRRIAGWITRRSASSTHSGQKTVTPTSRCSESNGVLCHSGYRDVDRLTIYLTYRYFLTISEIVQTKYWLLGIVLHPAHLNSAEKRII